MTIASTSTPSCALGVSCGFYRDLLAQRCGQRYVKFWKSQMAHADYTMFNARWTGAASMALSSSDAGRTSRERGSSSVYVTRKAKCRRRQGCYLKCLVDAGSVCSHPHGARVRIWQSSCGARPERFHRRLLVWRGTARGIVPRLHAPGHCVA